MNRWCQISARVAVQHQLVANHREGVTRVVFALGHLVLRLDHREVAGGVEVIQQLHVAGRGPPSPQAPSSQCLSASIPLRRAGDRDARVMSLGGRLVAVSGEIYYLNYLSNKHRIGRIGSSMERHLAEYVDRHTTDAVDLAPGGIVGQGIAP